MYNQILVVIPAYNEERTIGDVLKSLSHGGFTEIVVVDDGSNDKTAEIVNLHKTQILKHPTNIGVGGAISTGLGYAKHNQYKYAITMDADGQHHVQDVIELANILLESKNSLIIGNRLHDMQKKHKSRFIINTMADFIISLFSKKYIQDTQSGLRGFTKEAINKIELETSGYEVCSEMIIKASRENIGIKQLNIQSIYTEYTLQKGQKITNAINLLYKLVVNEIKN